MRTFHKPKYSFTHSGPVLIVATDYKFLTIKNTSTIYITINATLKGGDVTTTVCVPWHPACHCNFQNSQPALFEIQAIAGESVGDFGLA